MQSGIFSQYIISVEVVSISFELFTINYSSKVYVKENTSLDCCVFSLLVTNHLFQGKFIVF